MEEMKRIELAQYLTKEFLKVDKTVIRTEECEDTISWKILFDDGTEIVVIGKFASDIKRANE